MPSCDNVYTHHRRNSGEKRCVHCYRQCQHHQPHPVCHGQGEGSVQVGVHGCSTPRALLVHLHRHGQRLLQQRVFIQGHGFCTVCGACHMVLVGIVATMVQRLRTVVDGGGLGRRSTLRPRSRGRSVLPGTLLLQGHTQREGQLWVDVGIDEIKPSPAPPSPPAAPPAPYPAAPSGWKMGEPKSMSDKTVPAGTVTRCELSLLSTAAMRASSFSALASSSPKLTMSSATLFFLSFLPILVSSSCVAEYVMMSKRCHR